MTEIEARWLPEVAKPLVRLSGPIEGALPHYSAAADAVVTTHDASFGQHEWPMPAQEQPCADVALQARYFAAALLDGSVLPSMKGRCTICLLYSVTMPDMLSWKERYSTHVKSVLWKEHLLQWQIIS